MQVSRLALAYNTRSEDWTFLLRTAPLVRMPRPLGRLRCSAFAVCGVLAYGVVVLLELKWEALHWMSTPADECAKQGGKRRTFRGKTCMCKTRDEML